MSRRGHAVTVMLIAFMTALRIHWASSCMKVAIDAFASARYIGCYDDRSDDRDLPNRAGNAADMTVERCFQMCKLFKSGYIGLQRGTECWCGDSYGFHGRAPEDLCYIPCPGERKKYCGGKSQNSVYSGYYEGQPKNQKVEAEDSHLE